MGRCCDKNSRRIFLLSQIRSLRLVENSIYTIPPDFCLKDQYCRNWGVWTEEGAPPPETVRLRVEKGLCEKFRVTRYHDSQQTVELPDGKMEVTFLVSGAQEMLPWLMAWGAGITLLEPRWLVEELKSQLDKTRSAYAE